MRTIPIVLRKDDAGPATAGPAGGPTSSDVHVDAVMGSGRKRKRRRPFITPIALPVRKYSPDQPRDDHGRWTSGGGGGGGSADGAKGGGSAKSGEEGPFKVHTITEAVQRLGAGQAIMLERPHQVVTLLDRLASIVNDAKAKGEKAPVYDLCKVSVANTNLFCAQNMGISRSAMPQLKGKPAPGSPADAMVKDDKGEVDLGLSFRRYLQTQGIDVTDESEHAGFLRASQRELNGGKVAGMASAMEAGKIPSASIFISSDNYIVDGHHRWAATVATGMHHHRDLMMPVARIHLGILPVLNMANSYAASMGIGQAGVEKGRGPICVDCPPAVIPLAKFNPHHAPAGSPVGGQFTSADGGPGGDGPVHIDPHYGPPSARLNRNGKMVGSPVNPNATSLPGLSPEFRAKIEQSLREGSPTGTLDQAQIERNLEQVYQHAQSDPAAMTAKTWYNDANSFAHSLDPSTGDFSTSVGIVAALSPQTDWYSNQAMARFVADNIAADTVVHLGPDTVATLFAQSTKSRGETKNVTVPDDTALSKMTPGQAAWALMGMAKAQQLTNGRITATGKESRASLSMGSGNIAKAVEIARGADPADVLSGHKVRSFFDNIADPNDEAGHHDVTIDTHAVSAGALFRVPAAGSTIKRMFDRGGSTGDNAHGSYAIFADAYRAGARRHHLFPDQFQAIVWTHWQTIPGAHKGYRESFPEAP